MTRFGSHSTGLLGLGRWKLWISSWKVTIDMDWSLHIPQFCWHPSVCRDARTSSLSLTFLIKYFHWMNEYSYAISTHFSNYMHYFTVFMWTAYIWSFFFAPVFNCSTIWITVKLESSTHALLANSEAFWLLALHVVFVLFLISLQSVCLSVRRGQCFQTLAILTFFFLSLGSLACWIRM